MSELFLLFVQGVDLKHQPTLSGRAYKSKQLNEKEHGHLAVLELCLCCQARHSLESYTNKMGAEPGIWVCPWGPSQWLSCQISRQISSGKQGAEVRFPMSLTATLVSDHFISVQREWFRYLHCSLFSPSNTELLGAANACQTYSGNLGKFFFHPASAEIEPTFILLSTTFRGDYCLLRRKSSCWHQWGIHHFVLLLEYRLTQRKSSNTHAHTFFLSALLFRSPSCSLHLYRSDPDWRFI